MSRIELLTEIAAPLERCFDRARDLDLHAESMSASGERAIGGRTTGLIERGETVTWQARHFGIRWRMTSRITEMDRPRSFVDEMVRGPFARFRHEHRFREEGGRTVMTDVVDFAAPLGPLGRIVAFAAVGPYLRRLLTHRNEFIKRASEGD